eukprot:RCo027659
MRHPMNRYAQELVVHATQELAAVEEAKGQLALRPLRSTRNFRRSSVLKFKKQRALQQAEFKDETLTCRDCGKEFVFDVALQVLLSNRFQTKKQNRPKRCVACFAAFWEKKHEDKLKPKKKKKKGRKWRLSCVKVIPDRPYVTAVVDVHDFLKKLLRPAFPLIRSILAGGRSQVYVELPTVDQAVDAISARFVDVDGAQCKVSLPHSTPDHPIAAQFVHVDVRPALEKTMKSLFEGVTEVYIGRRGDTLSLMMESFEAAAALRAQRRLEVLGQPVYLMAREEIGPPPDADPVAGGAEGEGAEDEPEDIPID